MMESIANYKSLASLTVFKSVDEISVAFSVLLEKGTVNAAKKNKHFHIALSGGSTPLKIFEKLTQNRNILFDRLKIYWGDERCVPPDHPESNYGNAFNVFLKNVPIPASQIYRMKGENTPSQEKLKYASILKNMDIDNSIPSFDLVMLGLGEDGHTASIFPGDMEMFSTDKLVEETRHPESGQKRLTLTGKVLNNAKHVLFLVTGDNKSDVIQSIFNDQPEAKKYPAWYIRPSGKLSWFIDQSAFNG